MGMINEGRHSEHIPYDRESVSTLGHRDKRPTVLIAHTHESQYGYRSGPLGTEELAAIQLLDSTGKRSDIVKQIDALERIERATSNVPMRVMDPFKVHERKHQRTTRTPSRGTFTSPARRVSGRLESETGTYFTDLSNMWLPYDTALNPEIYRAEASSLMRNIVPTRPEVDLTRFIAELRDVSQIYRFAANLPETVTRLRRKGRIRDGQAGINDIIDPDRTDIRVLNDLKDLAGGGWLSYQFGIAPTYSDIMKGAEAVVKADAITRQFVSDSASLVKRKYTRTIESSFGSKTTDSLLSAFGQDGNTYIVQSDTGNFRWQVTNRLRPGNISLSCAVTDQFEASAQRTLHVFSTFEYFVGDPDKALSRMDMYKAQAEKLLGGGASASVAYELTPWSWMIDWFSDIGGLLRYQEQVTRYGTVARRSGFTISDSLAGTYRRASRPNAQSLGQGIVTPTTATWSMTRSHRVPGSPYSMDVSWDGFSAFQWSILGALGLSKSPGVPNIAPTD